ncbi:MAG: serine/threonine protein kinase [Labilithrix sp.]|nr:serine/threonine protein kinase [Labilithrix sp.]MCW5809955.1 serine/threonine protein kinase [Labilithrix sp.]
MAAVAPDPTNAIEAGLITPIAELGRGGMATAYLVSMQQPSGSDKLMVVKRLRRALSEEADFVRMFLQEARLSARLNHPNIVKTTEVGVDSSLPFIVMEYLDGQAFEAVSKRFWSRPATVSDGANGEPDLFLRVSIHVLQRVLLALHHAHELKDVDGSPLNVVHRDVSPHNVMVTYDGTVKLLDFGIAKAADSSAETRTGMIKGKCAYMAAEQFGGKNVDRRADVFAVGVMLWQALAGRPLWKGLSDSDIFRRVSVGDIPLPSSINPRVLPDIEVICMKALALSATNRYATAEEFHAALEDWLRDNLDYEMTTAELGAVVSELFATERQKIQTFVADRREAIRAQPKMPESSSKIALLPSDTGPNSTGTGSNTGPGNTGPLIARSSTADPLPVTQPKSKALLFSLAGLAAAVVVAGIVFARPQAPVATTPTPSTAPTSDPTPAATTCVLTLRAQPANAKLYFDDAPLDSNPGSITVQRGPITHRVRVEAEGFQPKSSLVSVDEPEVTVDVTLDPSPAALSSATVPATAPAPAPDVRKPVGGRPSARPSAAPSQAPAPAPSPVPAPKPPPSGKLLDESDPWKK